MTNLDEVYRHLDFALTSDQAQTRSDDFRYVDPLPEIKPALLNRSDIANYVSKTGMIFPFSPNKLKPASYEIELGNEVLYWDKNGEKNHLTNLTPKNTITIRRNSITYVGVAAKFQLPYYIALRFNLSITHVHRGLLLGTGPLIDPGFNGKIMIPIHNLTTNDYTIRPGDDLIAVEFTKLSQDDLLREEKVQKAYGTNVKKPKLSFNDYIESAIRPLKTVESSLEQAIRRAEDAVKGATEKVEQVRHESSRTSKIITAAGIFTAAALVITTFAAFFQIKSMIADTNKYVSDAAMIIKDENGKLYDLRDSIKINYISKQFAEHTHTIKLLNEKIIIFNNEINSFKEKLVENENKYKTLLERFQKMQRLHKDNSEVNLIKPE